MHLSLLQQEKKPLDQITCTIESRSKHKVGIQQAWMQSGWGGDLLFSNSGLCFALLEQLCLIKHLQ
jgi:hypothetical protein